MNFSFTALQISVDFSVSISGELLSEFDATRHRTDPRDLEAVGTWDESDGRLGIPKPTEAQIREQRLEVERRLIIEKEAANLMASHFAQLCRLGCINANMDQMHRWCRYSG